MLNLGVVIGLIKGFLKPLKSALDGQTDRLNQVALTGHYNESETQEEVYLSLNSGFINSDGTTGANAERAYIWLTSEQELKQLRIDTETYRYNLAYMLGDTVKKYTSWQTADPIVYDDTAHDKIGITVKRANGGNVTNRDSIIHYTETVAHTVGDLATRAYVDSRRQKGIKRIYPDGFTSRIKPDIYFNGRFYADIDIDGFKVSGSGAVWVAKNGNDITGDGSENNPYATITKALTTAAVTIHIKEGTYTQGTDYETSVNFAGKNIIGHGNVVLQNDSSGHYAKANASAYIENITFKHGNATTNPAFYAIASAEGDCICFVDCVFRDGGTNGISSEGADIVAVRCVAYGNKLDGFNYHDKTISGSAVQPNVIEIDCKAYNNGSDQSGSDSCNGSTAHDGSKVIRLNGEYYSCYGGVIAEIARAGEEPTISVNFGVLAHDSTGTSTYKASFWASINTQMYLYDCSCYGGTYDITAVNDAKVVSRRLTTGRDVPEVSEAGTATVIQY